MFILCKSPSSYKFIPAGLPNCSLDSSCSGMVILSILSTAALRDRAVARANGGDIVAHFPAYTRELDRESAWTRIHLTPLLVAEADRDLYRRTKASIAREVAIMEHVPGWKVRKLNLNE